MPFDSIPRRVHEDGERPRETVRALLARFDAQRRGRGKVRQIREALAEHSLITVPDFDVIYIDDEFTYFPIDAPELRPRADLVGDTVEAHGGTEIGNGAEIASAARDVVQELISSELGAKVGHIQSANRPPRSVSRDDAIQTATTLMSMNDFSQLPVLQGDRKVHGWVSWRSIGKARTSNAELAHVRDAINPRVRIIKRTDSLFSVIDDIIKHDAVLVVDEIGKVCGIVTVTDLSEQFRMLTEPFLLVGEVESAIRSLINNNLTLADIQGATSPDDTSRVVKNAFDLTFGEYVRLVENPTYWSRLGLNLDRKEFVARLKEINAVRNDVMHFDPDGISSERIEMLRQTVRFLMEVMPRTE